MHRLKIFLVEDEYVVREGIKKNVDWQESWMNPYPISTTDK